MPVHAQPDAKAHLTQGHGFEVAPTTTNDDAITAHDSLPDHHHNPAGDPVWVDPLSRVLLPPNAPRELRPIASLTDPAERVGAWAKQMDRYRELIGLCGQLRRDDVGRVWQATVTEGFRTKGTPGSWPEVDRRLGLNPGRAYRIWRGNE